MWDRGCAGDDLRRSKSREHPGYDVVTACKCDYESWCVLTGEDGILFAPVNEDVFDGNVRISSRENRSLVETAHALIKGFDEPTISGPIIITYFAYR
jgi:hypothetical protein